MAQASVFLVTCNSYSGLCQNTTISGGSLHLRDAPISLCSKCMHLRSKIHVLEDKKVLQKTRRSVHWPARLRENLRTHEAGRHFLFSCIFRVKLWSTLFVRSCKPEYSKQFFSNLLIRIQPNSCVFRRTRHQSSKTNHSRKLKKR